MKDTDVKNEGSYTSIPPLCRWRGHIFTFYIVMNKSRDINCMYARMNKKF